MLIVLEELHLVCRTLINFLFITINIKVNVLKQRKFYIGPVHSHFVIATEEEFATIAAQKNI